MTTALLRDDLRQKLTEAAQHHQAGRLREAEAVYRAVLRAAPEHASTHYNLAVALRGLGENEAAAAQYRRALALKPDNAKAHSNLAIILAEQGRPAEAETHYRQAIAVQPDHANAHYNLANLLRQQGRVGEAIGHYQRSLKVNPDDPDAHNNLGIALAADGDQSEAVAAFEHALALRPDFAEAWNNLAATLEQQGDLAAAGRACLRALALVPGYADAHYNLGHVLDVEDKVEDAESRYRLAVAIDPSHAKAHNNLGFLLQRQGRLDEALARYERAQALDPDYADAHWNEALARLLTGDFAIGWRKYAWRARRPETPSRTFAEPAWDGGNIAGRTILLYAEQGMGDAMQFIRYAPLVKDRGARVVVECHPELRRLFATAAGTDALAGRGDALPAFDCHASLLDVPALLGTALETVPAGIPYLHAEPALIAEWRSRLEGSGALKVGLAWRGNPAHANDRRRSVPAQTMARLAAADGVSWFCLQPDARPDELAAFAPSMLNDCGKLLRDWADTAALIAALDLVITVDTSVAHLAGALGKPAWVLLPFAPDWRWLLDREDSPWYPTLRLFRQAEAGEWEEVLERVGFELTEISPPPSPPPPGREAPLSARRNGGLRPRGRALDHVPPPRGGRPGGGDGSAVAMPQNSCQRPPAMVVSHERSGTHFLMNALAYAYGYTSDPWIDLDAHAININYFHPPAIAEALAAQAGNPLSRIVKSHHAVAFFADQLERITEDFTIFYIHRHPAAVMESLWRHLNGIAWNEGPKLPDPLQLAMAEPGGQMMRYQTRQYPSLLARWAAHVEEWVAAAADNPRIVLVRYEDLDQRYAETVDGLSEPIGRPAVTTSLRPPRDAGVIAMGHGRVADPAIADALRAFCKGELGPLLTRLGYE